MRSREKNESVFRWLGSLFILPLVVFYTINMGKFTFVDYVNLLIHEGGHGVFSFFGKFIQASGGTLMQIIIPSMFVVFYWIKKKTFPAQLFLVWLGENLINISVYASDARVRKLPLLGGNKVYHDWNYLLQTTGLIEYDTLIGNIFYGFGIIVFVVALLMPVFIKKYQSAQIDLNL
jgi:hypothetical protein